MIVVSLFASRMVTIHAASYNDNTQNSPSMGGTGHSDQEQESPSFNKTLLGDVNGDGSITMADANAVVNYYLATNKPEDFDVESADVNGDGDITMADANMIVNMFLEGEK